MAARAMWLERGVKRMAELLPPRGAAQKQRRMSRDEATRTGEISGAGVEGSSKEAHVSYVSSRYAHVSSRCDAEMSGLLQVLLCAIFG